MLRTNFRKIINWFCFPCFFDYFDVNCVDLKYLNTEYADLSRQLTAALCRKRPSPLVKGQAKSWACGIIHALGMVNFLDDSSQTPQLIVLNLLINNQEDVTGGLPDEKTN